MIKKTLYYTVVFSITMLFFTWIAYPDNQNFIRELGIYFIGLMGGALLAEAFND